MKHRHLGIVFALSAALALELAGCRSPIPAAEPAQDDLPSSFAPAQLAKPTDGLPASVLAHGKTKTLAPTAGKAISTTPSKPHTNEALTSQAGTQADDGEMAVASSAPATRANPPSAPGYAGSGSRTFRDRSGGGVSGGESDPPNDGPGDFGNDGPPGPPPDVGPGGGPGGKSD